MTSPQASRWMSFLEENLLEEDIATANPFFWYAQTAPNQCGSMENDSSKGDSDDQDKLCIRKRSRDESSNGASASKACREKMRRDRLNDRFMELSAILESGKTPKTDKATILADAVKVVTRLRTEAKQLKEETHQLKEAVKELKAEKNELREEKMRLKAEKERLEHHIKAMIIPSSYAPNPASMHAAVAALAPYSHIPGHKSTSVSGLPGMMMCQYLPAGAIDTSQDHVLRPPVA